MNCELIADQKLIFDYADGRLDDARAEELEAHLSCCAACRAEEVRLRCILAEISAIPPDESLLVSSAGETPVTTSCLPFSHSPSENKQIEDRYIACLKVALAARDFKSAQQLIDYHLDTLQDLDPAKRNAPALVALFARWMDMGYAHVGAGKTTTDKSRLEMLKSCLREFPTAPRPLMTVQDVLHLRMASAYAALAEHRHEPALADFELVASLAGETLDREWPALAEFGIAKIYRRTGEYDRAKEHLERSIRLAGEASRPQMVAGFSIMQAWLEFQNGKIDDAKEILVKAEATLRRTKDHLRLGNIRSVLGRIAQREGRYHDAVRCYDQALFEYGKWSRKPKHPNFARTLVNRAFVLRLLALRQADSLTASELRRNARSDLRRASRIYANVTIGRGHASTAIVSALLQLDELQFDTGEREAEEGYQLAADKIDRLAMARARLVQCMIANRRLSEAPGARRDAFLERALSCAGDAVQLAAKTQNRRLQARAYIWRGLTLLACRDDCTDSAVECLTTAKGLLEPRGGNYAAEELMRLEQEIETRRRAQVRVVDQPALRRRVQ